MTATATATMHKNTANPSLLALLRCFAPPAARRVRPPTVREATLSWLDAARPTLKRSTLSTYTRAAEAHLFPALGDCPVNRLRPEAVTALLLAKTQGDAPLSAATVRCAVSVLRGAVEFAARQGYATPPASAIRAPGPASAESRTLSPEAQARLEAYLRRDMSSAGLGILICMYTGLRVGEICALKWGDVAPDAGCLTVRRTVQRIRSLDAAPGEPRTQVVFDAPKSRSANRTIPLPDFLAELLRGARRGPDCFLLTGEAERFMEPRSMQGRFKTALRAAGVEDVNFHALRHSFATRCVELGFDVKTLSEIMGHSDVSLTLNTYVHPSMQRMRSMMARLESRVG